MDTFNRSRFAAVVEVLAEWESVSNVFGPVRPSEDEPISPEEVPPTGGEPGKAA
jgi:hypothetical protein